MEWLEDMFATEPVLVQIEKLEQQLIEAEALLFRSQLLLDGQDYSEKLFVEINDYYKQYILPTHKK